jgi:hypothetical protein
MSNGVTPKVMDGGGGQVLVFDVIVVVKRILAGSR